MTQLTRSLDGMALVPPGGGAPFVATSVAVPGATGVLAPGVSSGHVSVAVVGSDDRPPAGTMLTILDPDAEESLRDGGGERAVRRRLRELTTAGCVLASPLEPAAYDTRPSQAVVLPAREATPSAVLASLLRAGDRPLLVDVRHDEISADELVAAIDVGAAGAIIRTGQPDRDHALAEALIAADSARRKQAASATVVVCNYNGARYLDRCFAALTSLEYPDYEVIMVDDGSTDDSLEIGHRHGVRVIALERVGLSAARNVGLEAAHGDWVAYIDGDTEAEPHWLMRLWRAMDRLDADGASGPNLPFANAGWQERAVSGAPGTSKPIVDPDGSATMLSGCNMAFRRTSALAVGGFDKTFDLAFDDVDISLRLREAGKRLVVAPTASIFHHRRDTIKGFVRQQYRWGKAREAFERLNSAPNRVAARTPARSSSSGPSTRLLGRVFQGPHAEGLWMLTNAPAMLGLPLKVLLGIGAVAVATIPIAWLADAWAIWAVATIAAIAALFAIVAARVPVCAAPRGLAGLGQRLATGALWFVQRIAYRLGSARARA